MGKAIQDLRDEHASIHHVLSLMDRMLMDYTSQPSVKLRYYNELTTFYKVFADACHHGKEERYLFRYLASLKDPKIDGILEELKGDHTLARLWVGRMDDALFVEDLNEFARCAREYRDLLILHIEKEDRFFALIDGMMDDEVQRVIYSEFELHEEDVIGYGVHEELHKMIDQWGKIFNRK